jgi:hypothetical protein
MIMKNSEKAVFPINGDVISNAHLGLTKREYFAAKALQGLLTLYDDTAGCDIVPNESNVIYMTKLAVKAADYLLLELENDK